MQNPDGCPCQRLRRSTGLTAIRNVDGYRDSRRTRRSARATTANGYCIPTKSTPPTRLSAPTKRDYDHAENILDAYAWFTSDKGGRGARSMLGDEMIDEASRKMALVIAARGRAAGMDRNDVWTAPQPGRRSAGPDRTGVGFGRTLG